MSEPDGLTPKAEWRLAVEECIERIGVSAPFFVRNVMRALVPDDDSRPTAIDGQAWPSENEIAGALLKMRGSGWNDNTQVLQAAMEEAAEIRAVLNLLAAAPPAQGSAGWKLLRDEFREAVTAKDESTLSDVICRIMGSCDCPGDHGADPETALCWKAAKAIIAPPVEAQDGRSSLVEIDGCFQAALAEGWNEALASGNIEAIRDIWNRRLSFAQHEAARGLAPPVEAQGSERMMREALEQVLKFRRGDPPYCFARLPDDQRDNAYWDAWHQIETQILAAFGDSSPATVERYGLWIDPGPKR